MINLIRFSESGNVIIGERVRERERGGEMVGLINLVEVKEMCDAAVVLTGEPLSLKND